MPVYHKKAKNPISPDSFSNLPDHVQVSLREAIGSAKDGLLALSVTVGLNVLKAMMEAEVAEIVGPKGKHNPNRQAVRHGSEKGSVVLGGRKVAVRRPRVSVKYYPPCWVAVVSIKEPLPKSSKG